MLQFAQLTVYRFIVGVGDGFSDFSAQVAAEAFAEAMHGLAGGGFVELEHGLQLSVVAAVLTESQEGG